MKYQGGIDTLKEATKYMFQAPSAQDILFVVGGILAVFLILMGIPYFISKYIKVSRIHKEFIEKAKLSRLTDEEAKLLWKYSKDMGIDAVKLFETKPLFEKVVNKIVNEEIDKVNLIASIRRKLNFDTIPWFIPLSNSREIDLYQTGFVMVGKLMVSAAVWNKTETELHIALLDKPPFVVREGDKIKFAFQREDEGKYIAEFAVKNIYTEGTKQILVVEHTDKLEKVHLREGVRWKVNLPVKFWILGKKVDIEKIKTSFNESEYPLEEATIEDISTSGIRICRDGYIPVEEKDYVLVEFDLEMTKLSGLLGEIRNKNIGHTRTCIGIKFLNVPKAYEDKIRKFILNEQKKILKAYKMGKL